MSQHLIITLADRTKHTVTPTLEDRLKFEQALRKNRSWGPLADNALKMQPFLAWSAAVRAGVTALSWEEFTSGETSALDVEVEPEADDDGLEVDGLGKDTPTEAITPSASLSDSISTSLPGNGVVSPNLP